MLAGDGWHPGVVGIVASRVVERYGRPTFLIAFDGDIGKGSGRSISRFDLHAALRRLRRSAGAVRRPPDGGGAHHPARAAEAFRERFGGVARRDARPRTISAPSSGWTSRSSCSEVTDDLERLCRYLEPCGTGNASPVFGVRGVRFAGRGRVGKGHLKGMLDDGTLPACRPSDFSGPTGSPWLGDEPVDAAFRLECNEWNGQARSRRGSARCRRTSRPVM